MKLSLLFTLVLLQASLPVRAQNLSRTEAAKPMKYECQILQDRYSYTEPPDVYGTAVIEMKSGHFQDIIVDMPQSSGLKKKMRAILTVGQSQYTSQLHVNFTAVDKKESLKPEDWIFAFQLISEYSLGTPFITMRASTHDYVVRYTCKLLKESRGYRRTN